MVPWHPLTRASQRAVVPGGVTRFDIDVRPAFATLQPGHRLVLTLLSSQTPHLLPIPGQQAQLLGGVYRVQRSARAASYIELPLR
jgi:predicted acyl esterase